MNKTVFASLALAAALTAAASAPAAAQSPIPFAIEGRLDRAIPTGDFDRDVEAGFSAGVGASVQVVPGIGVYGTYSWTGFGAGPTRIVEDAVDEGFSVGATVALPAGSARVAPWVGAGLVLHDLEWFGNGDVTSDPGFELGAGLAITVLPRVRLTPALAYRSYHAEVLADDIRLGVDVNYFTAGVGLNLSF